MTSIVDVVKKVKNKGLYGSCTVIGSKVLKIPRNALTFTKLRRRVQAYGMKLYETGDINEIRKRTLNYIESMRIKKSTYGQYKYSQSQTEPVLYASLYAALTRHLYRDLEELSDKQREGWIDYIQSHQTDDGLFKDNLIENEIASTADWWGWRHLTLHAIMALAAFDATAEKRFKLLEPFKDHKFVNEWLESRNWRNDPAGVSNEIQNYTTLLQYARDFQNEKWAGDAVKWILDWLDENQDPETGLWGNRFDTPYFLSIGVQTGYHLWLLYFYDKRLIKYVDRIVDSVLKSQNSLGGFGVAFNSSACEDIDSIDPLVRLYFYTDYRREDIKKVLQKALPWVLTNMNEDGGFVFRRFESFKYGHEKMYSRAEESAMFPTWFRTLSLAYLSKILPNSVIGKFNWQFLRCPGMQFWND